jgi:hypothetical protein
MDCVMPIKPVRAKSVESLLDTLRLHGELRLHCRVDDGMTTEVRNLFARLLVVDPDRLNPFLFISAEPIINWRARRTPSNPPPARAIGFDSARTGLRVCLTTADQLQGRV